MGKSNMVGDLYKPSTSAYKLFFLHSPIYQQFTQSKYKSQNLDISGFL